MSRLSVIVISFLQPVIQSWVNRVHATTGARNMHGTSTRFITTLIWGSIMLQAEMESAQRDVLRSRAQVADTLATLRERVTEPVAAVRRKLDLADAVHRNPWPALAIALGAGAFVAASGADARAASAAAQAARQGVQGAAHLAQQAAEATSEAARHAPSKTREALVVAAEALATRLALAFIASLRENRSPPAAAQGEGMADFV